MQLLLSKMREEAGKAGLWFCFKLRENNPSLCGLFLQDMDSIHMYYVSIFILNSIQASLYILLLQSPSCFIVQLYRKLCFWSVNSSAGDKEKKNKKNGGFGRTCCSPWSCHLGAQQLAKPTQRSDTWFNSKSFFFFGCTL